jgi:hypothetical protein
MRTRAGSIAVMFIGLVTAAGPVSAAVKGEIRGNCTYAVRQGTAQVSATTGCQTLATATPKQQAAAVPWDECEQAARARTTNPGALARTFQVRTGGGAVLGTAPTMGECMLRAWTRLDEEGRVKESGSNVSVCMAITKFSTVTGAASCQTTVSYLVSYTANTTCTPPNPSVRTVQCPSGQLGAWAQTATQGAPPTCSVTWAPTAPPVGACFTMDRAANLSWTPPTRNTDGTALSNLGGFRLSYGRTATELTQTVQISQPTVKGYTLTDLDPGDWYFNIRAFTLNGTESANSNTVKKTTR